MSKTFRETGSCKRSADWTARVPGVRVLRVLLRRCRLCIWVLRAKCSGAGRSAPQHRRSRLPFNPSRNRRSTAGEDKPGLRRLGQPPSWASRAIETQKYRIAFGFAAAGVLGMATTFAGMMVYYTVVFPDPLAIRNNERAPLIRILARDGSVLAERGAAHDYVPLDLCRKSSRRPWSRPRTGDFSITMASIRSA